MQFCEERDKTVWKFRNGKQIWRQHGEEGYFLCRTLAITNTHSGEAEVLTAWEQ